MLSITGLMTYQFRHPVFLEGGQHDSNSSIDDRQGLHVHYTTCHEVGSYKYHWICQLHHESTRSGVVVSVSHHLVVGTRTAFSPFSAEVSGHTAIASRTTVHRPRVTSTIHETTIV